MLRFVAICLVLLLTSCTEKEPLFNSQSYVFGTLVDITIYGEPDHEANMIASTIMKEYQRLHNDLHAWKPSKISGINKQIANGNTAHTNDEIAALLTQVSTLSSNTNGLFNPAIGKLIKLWGFQDDHFQAKAIDYQTIEKLVYSHPKMSDLTIDGNKIGSRNPDVQIDLGGVAKGYALDLGLNILKEHGVKNALINIGGNVIALGKHGDRPWQVGIQHPRKPNAIASLNLESGWAIGTSGDYQRYFMLDGKRYCHIINPNTGYPAQGTQSVTVLIPPKSNTGLLSDIVSKPIFIAETNQKRQAIQQLDLKDVMIIQENGDILVTPSMQKRLQWLESDVATHINILQ